MMDMPEHVCFSSFPPPTIPTEERPWNANNALSEDQFKTECRRWDINEIVFTQVWDMYHPLLRADFTLFDEYNYNHGETAKYSFPMTMFSAKDDRMITEAMCNDWKEKTSKRFELVPIDGHHLFPLDKEQKDVWLKRIVKDLDGVMEVIELKLIYGM